MKSMKCNQLGGACDKVFKANTFEEIVELSKQHGTKMFKVQDSEHLEAMNKIQVLMQNPEKMGKWFENKKQEFANLPED